MWQEIGVSDIEGRLEALKLSIVCDHNIGSDFENACEYFVRKVLLILELWKVYLSYQEISGFDNVSDLVVLPGIFLLLITIYVLIERCIF
jgi:hypothetical protein